MAEEKHHKPPKWADRFLEWYCAPHQLEDVQGALYEYFFERVEQGQAALARRMFVLDVLTHFRLHIIKRKGTQNKNNITMLSANLKFSLRSLWKHKLTTILNTLGLTIGIACFITIMIWVDNEKNFDTFHQKADHIYRISNTFKSESEEFSQAVSGPALGAQLDDLFPQVLDAVRIGQNSAQIRANNNNYFENGMLLADVSFMDIFDFEVVQGNASEVFKDIHSIVLTESTARKYFGDEPALGKELTMDEQVPMKVTGVMADVPPNSQIQFDMVVSMEFAKDNWGLDSMDYNWGGGWFHTYLLLEDGIDPRILEQEITDFIKPKLSWFTERNMSYTYFLKPLKSIHLESDLRYDFPNNRSEAYVSAFTTVGIIVLLLACINYINLTTANAVKRSKEIGVKKVMGAYKVQLIGQYLVESILLVFIATLLSIGLVSLILPGFEDFIGYQIPVVIGPEVLVIGLAGVLVLGILAGLFPAATIASYKPLEVIKGKLTSGNKGTLIRKTLVVLQFTVTVFLMVAIITMDRQLNYIQTTDLGMATDEVVSINFRGVQSVRDNHQVLRDKLLENPAIKTVSFQRNAYPVNGLSNGTVMVERGDGSRVSSSLYHMWVDEAYAEVYGMEMVAGRFYDKSISTDHQAGVVVNEAAVINFGWTSPQDALGKEMGNAPNVRKVIGVVKDFNFEGLHKKIEPLRILPVDNNEYGMIAIRADLSKPLEVLNYLEDTWAEINPTVPLDYAFMDDDIQQQYIVEMSFRSVFLFFSTLSIAIACLGLFGLATAATNQRIKEIGIRKVLGASASRLIGLMSIDFLKLVLIASVLATPIAWYGLEQWLSSYAYRIDLTWVYFALAGFLAVLVSLLTVSYQSIKAAVSNPVRSLRYE